MSNFGLWIHNKLQLNHVNEDKTETFLTSPSVSADLLLNLKIGHSDIQFSDSAQNLGVIFDNRLSMKGQVNNICQIAYFELRKIGYVRQYLTNEATKTLVTSLVRSRLD